MDVNRDEDKTRGAERRWAIVVLLLSYAAPSPTSAQKSVHSVGPKTWVQQVAAQPRPSMATFHVGSKKCQPGTIMLSLRKHEMPDVIDCTWDGVVNSFREFGGGAPQRDEQFSAMPVGQIVQQIPDSYSGLPQAKSIRLTISKGPNPAPPATTETPPIAGTPIVVVPVKVPNVVGSFEPAAQGAMAQSDLSAILRGDEPSSLLRGTVIRTEPAAGTSVGRRTSVSYWVASGSNVVPALVGQSADQSQANLTSAGFRAGVMTHRGNPGKVDLVLDQDPRANTIAPLNSSVATTISVLLVKEPVRVPSVPASTIVFLAGLFLGLAGLSGWLWHASRRRLIKATQRLLGIEPSLSSDGEMQVAQAIPMNGPTTALRAHLETGEVRFEGPVPIKRQETHHD